MGTDGPMRLQKYLARSGVASRRASEALIVSGRVTVNGVVSSELGAKVDPRCDAVALDGVPVCLPSACDTIMLNKPAGYVTTMDDPQGRPCVADLVPSGRFPGLFPVGRLDRDTTGLLLFTTDGELGAALLHPRHHVEKRYLALVEGALDSRDIARLRAGVRLSDGMTQPAFAQSLSGSEADVALAAFRFDEAGASGAGKGGRAFHGARGARIKGTSVVEVGLREGRNREVRRMLEAVGHPVIALHRRSFGPLSLGDLARGCWRELSGDEQRALRDAALGA